MVSGRAFFTSIPKCGKNLITALLDTLGLERIDDAASDPASAHVMTRWVLDARAAGRWLEPARDQEGLVEWADQTEASLLALAEHLRGLTAGYIHAHLGYDARILVAAQSAGVPIIFLYRDPRAMIASQAHFLLRLDDPTAYEFRPKVRDLDAAYDLLLGGDGTTLPAADVFATYEPWLTAPGVLAVRFEDLVGPRGGGSFAVQLATVARIAQHIGWTGSSSSLLAVAENIFNPTVGTFRRGTIDGWRGDVPPDVITRFAEYFTELPRRWGYDDADLVSPEVLAQRTAAWDGEVSADGVQALRVALVKAQDDGDERLILMRGLEERIAELAGELAHHRADNKERLALIAELQARLTDAWAERDHLTADNDDRLTMIDRLQAQLVDLRAAYERVHADGEERLALIERQQGELGRLSAELERVATDSADRLALIRRLETKLMRVTEERNQLRTERDGLRERLNHDGHGVPIAGGDPRVCADEERVALIRRLHAQLAAETTERERLSTESAERLAVARKLERRCLELAAESERIGQDSDERLALIRRLQNELAEVAAERDRLGAESDERLALVRQLEASLSAYQPTPT